MKKQSLKKMKLKKVVISSFEKEQITGRGRAFITTPPSCDTLCEPK
ncbi:hypothetical protein [uncultured Kordia sp.]|nr:hypothetical protein [uncultured Kordia sp.]